MEAAEGCGGGPGIRAGKLSAVVGSTLSHSAPQATFPRIDLDPPVRGAGAAGDPFEIGLVCAGSISAGCYIAGVLDYLIEALDRWYAAKAADPAGASVPAHDVVFRVVTGASGGAMSAALLAAARDRTFPHISAANVPQDDKPTGNPLFDAWVQKIDIKDLTGTRDLDENDGRIVALLDSSGLRAIGLTTLAGVATKPSIVRPYFDDPFRVMLTLSNMRGVPYWVPFQSATGAGHGMLQHGDHFRFAVAGSGRKAGNSHDAYPDEIRLDGPPLPVGDWATLIDAALASGAFPVGLAARGLTADQGNYAYRVTIPDPDQPAGATPRNYIALEPQAPDWPPAQSPIPFACVDGGTINNQPFDLAHRVLAGAHGQNPRSAKKATRAVLMVDPFPERPAYGPSDASKLSLIGSLPFLVNLLVEQCRFREEDILLAHDENVFSRFIVVPKRDGDGWVGKWHLASGSVLAFGGFLARSIRVHDYLLGRRNCQKFLLDHFTLPASHDLFKSWSGKPWAEQYWAQDDDGGVYVDPQTGEHHLPIIPVLRDAAGDVVGGEERLPAWPQGSLNASHLSDMIMTRIEALTDTVVGQLSFVVRGLLWPVKRAVLSTVKDRVSKYLSDVKEQYDF